MKSLRPDLHALTGAYAVHAIDDEVERARFEQHLRRCQPCAGEVRGLTETTTRLAFAVSRTAPAQMRDRVLLAISRTRQLPPVVGHQRSPAERRPGWGARTGWLAAAACLVVVIALSAALLRVQDDLDRARSRQTALSAVLTAPDARAITKATTAGGTATVVFSFARHSMIVTSAKLPPLPPGKVYQLWLLGPPVVRSGLLQTTAGNGHAPALVTGLVRGDELGLTVEPAGGTSKPTTTPILVMALRT